MTDPDTTLGRIDDVLSTCVCGAWLTKQGASLDYCSEDCQEEWQANTGRLRHLPGLVKLRRASAQIAAQATAQRGPVRGPGTRATSDSIPAWISEGEAMVPSEEGPVHLVGPEVERFHRIHLNRVVEANQPTDRSTA